jgi:hypothetical protein
MAQEDIVFEEQPVIPQANEEGELQYSEDESAETPPTEYTNICAAPIKRRRNAVDNIPEVQKRNVRRKLFTEEEEEEEKEPPAAKMDEVEILRMCPTVDRFVYGGEITNLRSPLPGPEGAIVILTNVYNTFLYIVRYKSTLISQQLKSRKLAIQLHTTEHSLRQLEENNYREAHIQLPRMVESLFSMWDYRNNIIYINQLRPVSCLLNKKTLLDNISFRSMEATIKNDSSYIELMFNNPYRFIFVGDAKRVGTQHDRNQVRLFPFFGEYINKAIADMYEVMYELVSKEIEKAKKLLSEADRLEKETRNEMTNYSEHQAANFPSPLFPPPPPPPNNSLSSMVQFSHAKNAASKDDKLHSFLRSIDLPLAKKDTVDIIITSGNSGKKNANADTTKMSYLTVEIDEKNPEKNCLKMVDTDIDDDSLYLSSYIRCRVLINEEGKFSLQIYTRQAIRLLQFDDRLVKFNELFNTPRQG